MKILIVDGSADIRERLVTMLRAMPNVEIAGQAPTAAEAMNAVRQLQPHVIILDARLPAAAGMDLLQAMHREQIRTFVIVLIDDNVKALARAAGAHVFLHKTRELSAIPGLIHSLSSDFAAAAETPSRAPIPPAKEAPG